MKKLVILFVLVLTGAMVAATMGTDNATNYSTDGFTNGANAGTGFQAWNISSSGSGGTFLGDSTSGNCGNINTDSGSLTQSFGMWGNPGAGNAINCNRKFAGGALSVGQKFSAKLGVNWRNGNKGIDILSGNQMIFNFNVGGDDYTYNPTNATATTLGWAYSANSVIDVVIEQKAGSVLNIDLTRGTDNFNQDFTLTGNADEFKLYCFLGLGFLRFRK